jgi:hypothetical protein
LVQHLGGSFGSSGGQPVSAALAHDADSALYKERADGLGAILKRNYLMSADGLLMPRKNQAPPDLRYFKQTPSVMAAVSWSWMSALQSTREWQIHKDVLTRRRCPAAIITNISRHSLCLPHSATGCDKF